MRFIISSAAKLTDAGILCRRTSLLHRSHLGAGRSPADETLYDVNLCATDAGTAASSAGSKPWATTRPVRPGDNEFFTRSYFFSQLAN